VRVRIVWKRGSDLGPAFEKPQEIMVESAWPYGEWLAYRKHGAPHITHYIPASAVWEIEIHEESSDPDPMRPPFLDAP
jgi:hypothetical protein